MKFTTIIPFYQRQEGLLTKAVESALHQIDQETGIIVVDDGSPIPAEDELSPAGLLQNPRLTVHPKANGGVSSARNAGLDLLPDGCGAVCFLDSDDRWEPGHLQHAAAALSLGYDFFFEDHIRDDWTEGKFARHGFHCAQHPVVCETPPLREWRGDFPHTVLSKHIVQTSTVVIRASLMSGIRFPTQIKLLEDDTTWVRVHQAGARTCFSESLGVRMGHGVNLSMRDAWGTMAAYCKSANLKAAWDQMFQYVAPTDSLEDLREQRLATLREDLARQFFSGSLGAARFSPRALSQLPAIAKGVLGIAQRRLSRR